MQLSQKISVSLDMGILNFIDRYALDHAAKGRSAVVAKALHLLRFLSMGNEVHPVSFMLLNPTLCWS